MIEPTYPKRVFSGIQPTGHGAPHLGNLLGAMREFPKLVGAARDDALYCVVDMHATTATFNPAALREATLVSAAALIAVGVATDRAIVFRQSAVTEHAYLAVVLQHISRLGELERMTQFKDKGRGDERDTIPLGLLTYPVLMAADILLYRTTHVPVGNDQHQHMQLAGELARRFNKRFGETFPRPVAVGLVGEHARVMSLTDPTRKMSKSEPEGAVFLTDTIEEAAKKFRRATSETEPLPSEVEGLDDRPAAQSLVGLLAGLSRRTVEDVLGQYGGQGFSALKSGLSEAFAEHVVPIGQRMNKMLAEPEWLSARLRDGEVAAHDIASTTCRRVREVVGF